MTKLQLVILQLTPSFVHFLKYCLVAVAAWLPISKFIRYEKVLLATDSKIIDSLEFGLNSSFERLLDVLQKALQNVLTKMWKASA